MTRRPQRYERERYTYDDLPPQPMRRAVCDWLRQHGIDPSRVPASGWIERRPIGRQVAYESTVLDENGRPRLAGGDFVRVARRVQLEEPPLPFPVGLPGRSKSGAR